MTPSAPDSPLNALLRRVANSKFFTVSALLHLLLILLFGGTVLFQTYVEPEDFEGGDGEFLAPGEVQAQPPTPTQTNQPKMETVAPKITPPTTNTTAITTANSVSTSFSINAAPQINPVALTKDLSDSLASAAKKLKSAGTGLPKSMSGRVGVQTGKPRKARSDVGESEISDKAVIRGLRWLKTVQKPDGSWGSAGERRAAMSGLALLAFLGHGETPNSPEFGETVAKAITMFIADSAKFNGYLTPMSKSKEGKLAVNVYAHGIATYALGEAYTMTRDERLVPVLQKAIAHIIAGQASDGGWMYNYDKSVPSDTSVSGWQIQALKAAKLTELEIPGVDESMRRALSNLERVYNPQFGSFGYRTAKDRNTSNLGLTGAGALCTLMIQPKPEGKIAQMVSAAVKAITTHETVDYSGPKANLYAWYYHTQACFQVQGAIWSKWNRMFQEEIAKRQASNGSWPPHGGGSEHGMNEQNIDGQVYRTALCCLMLEVYYRYLPSNKL